jgi:hypothetical protein
VRVTPQALLQGGDKKATARLRTYVDYLPPNVLLPTKAVRVTKLFYELLADAVLRAPHAAAAGGGSGDGDRVLRTTNVGGRRQGVAIKQFLAAADEVDMLSGRCMLS